MKRILASLGAVLIILSAMASAAFARAPLVVDNAGLLSDEEISTLTDRAEKIAYQYGIDTVVYYTDTLGGLEISEFADRVWRNGGYSDDCSIFVLAMREREYYLYNCGKASTVVTDFGSFYIDDKVIPCVSDGEYYKAAGRYLTYNAEFYSHYEKTGSAYDIDDKPNELKMLLISLFGNTGIGLLLAGVPLRNQKKSMNSVQAQKNAGQYAVRSMSLSVRNDRLVNKYINKVPIPRVESTGGPPGGGGHGGTTFHTSSSGHSFSGHGGKF